mgnify:CR=1 FL=1
MAYTKNDAKKTLFGYMGLNAEEIKYLDDTDQRGFILNYSGEDCVIFIYPISHKADDTKNFFDTRDSGAHERGVAWNYAISHNLKYFCFGVHDQVSRYVNYIFSLECNEKIIAEVAGTKNGVRAGSGTQVVIPNNYAPDKAFERIQTKNGFFISAIHKNSIYDYIEKYDNRPYLLDKEMISFDDADRGKSEITFVTGYKSNFERNRILFGAPGTGKSFTINNDAKELIGQNNETDYERVTFHPDYSYANFVGTYKPIPCRDHNGNDVITYAYVPGPFMRMYVKALENSREDEKRPFLLIIEEINRANVAAVFGDIFQLLDRGGDNTSEYPIQASEDIKKYLYNELGGKPEDYEKIRIPDNMFIWATMNSADQGVFPMDTAFKRRWDFTYLGIDDSDEKIRGKYVYLTESKTQKVEWNKLRKSINNFLSREKINEDKQLGPYFISQNIVVPEKGDEIERAKFISTFKNKVIMYLFEDAAKQKRSKLFEGCFQNSSRYSEICREFEKKGIGIFHHDIQIEAEPEEPTMQFEETE